MSQDTLDDIYASYAGMVYNLALTYVRNKEVAEEVTQDVFVTVYQKLDTFKGLSSLKTWVYRITINICLDRLKAAKRNKRFGIMSYLGKEEVTGQRQLWAMDHPGVMMEQKEATERIFRLIDTLPESQQTAMLLRVVEGLGPAETAELMNLSVKAVESLLSRGKRTLRDHLNPEKE